MEAGLEDASQLPAWLAHAKSLSPTALDFEIRHMSPADNLIEFRAFLHALAWTLETGKDFEVPETLLNHFLKVHGDVVIENYEELREELEGVQKVHGKVWGRIREQLNYAMCMIAFAQKQQ